MVLSSIAHQAEQLQAELVAVRRDFHMHPELAGEEERTAGIVAEKLNALGLEVTQGIGGHGVVGVLRGAQPGPVVAWRADMDAFPSENTLDVPYNSTVPGVKHVCGHDVHTTVGLGAAAVLASQREKIAGTIKFIFQPAEENATGAQAMICDGVLTDPAPEAIFGLHAAPLPVGTIGSVSGMILPGVTVFKLVYAYEGVSADVLQTLHQKAVQALVGLNTIPMDINLVFDPQAELSTFVTLGGIPIETETGAIIGLQGLVRMGVKSQREQVKNNIQDCLDQIMAEIPVQITFTWPETISLPDTVNDAVLEPAMRSVIAGELGAGNLVLMDKPVPFNSEDFSRYLEHIPGVFYWLGVANPAKGIAGIPHTPDFDVDEDCLPVGVRAAASLLLAYLARSA